MTVRSVTTAYWSTAYRWPARWKWATGPFWEATAPCISSARIGEHVMLSGGSLVSKDVPPFVKAAHNPLSFVGSELRSASAAGDFTAEQDRTRFRRCSASCSSRATLTRAAARWSRAQMPRSVPSAIWCSSFIRYFEARHPEAVQSEKAERRSRVGVFRRSVVSVAPYFGYV